MGFWSFLKTGICCAGTIFCGTVCCFCSSFFKTKYSTHMKIAYMVLIVIYMLLTIFLLYWVADHILDHFQSWIKCPDTTNGALSCLGISACYRMSFALAALFVIIFLAQLFRNDLSKMFNEGMWIIKFAVVLGIFIAVMYLSLIHI
eukprot:TRINITY_DN985_c0_g1_i11.p1 TRINITY_DN985_c0_g1~~TRINITY_DN985_c0_g1_i11.p1  ORF type:complete len:146 (-),score=15.75 TRINITY_DN985_c0_g1_i11:62-499(-)